MIVLEEPCSTTLCVIDFEGPLRTPRARHLRSRVQACLRAGRQTIVINLSGVFRIDAAGVGELVRAYNMTAAAKATLRIVDVTDWVREMLARAGLLNLLRGEEATAAITH